MKEAKITISDVILWKIVDLSKCLRKKRFERFVSDKPCRSKFDPGDAEKPSRAIRISMIDDDFPSGKFVCIPLLGR